MKELHENKIDALLTASLYRNVSKEAKAFLSLDVSDIVDHPRIKNRILKRAKTTPRALWRARLRIAAVACLIAASLAFTACMSIPEVRKALWNVLMSWHDDHVEIHFKPSDTAGAETGDKGSAATPPETPIPPSQSIEKIARATYLPEGYYAVEKESTALYADTFYYDANDTMKFQLIQQVLDEEADLDAMIDHENGSVTTMYINGQEGILVEYLDVPGQYYLVWKDAYYQYSLYGSFSSVAELMKIADGITTE